MMADTNSVYQASGWVHVETTRSRRRCGRDKHCDKPRRDVRLARPSSPMYPAASVHPAGYGSAGRANRTRNHSASSSSSTSPRATLVIVSAITKSSSTSS